MKPNYTLLTSEMHYSGAWNASGRLKEQQTMNIQQSKTEFSDHESRRSTIQLWRRPSIHIIHNPQQRSAHTQDQLSQPTHQATIHDAKPSINTMQPSQTIDTANQIYD